MSLNFKLRQVVVGLIRPRVAEEKQCIFGKVITCDGDERAHPTPQRSLWVATITQHEKKSLSLALTKQRIVARDPIKWELTPHVTSPNLSRLFFFPPFFLSTFVSVTLFLSCAFSFSRFYLSSFRTSLSLHVSYFQFCRQCLRTCIAIAIAIFFPVTGLVIQHTKLRTQQSTEHRSNHLLLIEGIFALVVRTSSILKVT